MGQGIRTVLSQIASEVTGFDYDSIEIITGDTGLIPSGAYAVAQRQTFLCGNAVFYASKKFMDKLSDYVAQNYGLKKEGIFVRGDRIVCEDNPGKIILTTKDLAQEIGLEGEKIKVEYTYKAPLTYPIKGDKQAFWEVYQSGEKGRQENAVDVDSDEYRNYVAYSYTTQIAIVEADEENGNVKLLKFISVHDVGKELNHQKIRGQLEGSVVMGMGYALSEEFVMENGINLTKSLRGCGIPTISQVPEIEIITIEDPVPEGPFGAKGISEVATVPTAPAITNAIYDALKIRIRKLPATREAILREIRKEKRYTQINT